LKNDKKLILCVSHLQGFKYFYNNRKQQLNYLYKLFEGESNVLIFGDLNLHYLEEDNYIHNDYIDCWKELNKDDKGYTYDSEKNLMIYEKNTCALEYRKMRLDRILLKSDFLIPKEISLYANEPIYKKNNNKYNNFDIIYYPRWILKSISVKKLFFFNIRVFSLIMYLELVYIEIKMNIYFQVIILVS
jgi:hypothetical protein